MCSSDLVARQEGESSKKKSDGDVIRGAERDELLEIQGCVAEMRVVCTIVARKLVHRSPTGPHFVDIGTESRHGHGPVFVPKSLCSLQWDE